MRLLTIPAACLLLSTAALAQQATIDAAKASAQSAVTFVVADSVPWVQAQGCSACHRGGGTLFGASIAKKTGFRVNDSASTGITWLANFVASEQQADGGWIHGGALRVAKTGFELFGLGGYTANSGDGSKIGNLERGIRWMATQAWTPSWPGMPASARIFQSTDWWSTPTLPAPPGGFTTTTAQVAIAIKVALDGDPGLADRPAFAALLSGIADAMEFMYTHSLGFGSNWQVVPYTWHAQDIVYGNIALVEAGRIPANNATAAAMRDDLVSRHLAGQGWGDPGYITASSNPHSTGEVLYALCRDGVRIDPSTAAGRAVTEGLTWLSGPSGGQAGDGSFGSPAQSSRDIPSIFALLGLGCYGVQNVAVTSGNPDGTSTTTVPVSTTTGTTPTTTTGSFTVTINNSGYTTNTYNITPTGGLPGTVLTATPPSLTLAPDHSGSSTISYTVPPGTPSSTVVPITVQTTYTTSTGASGQTSAYTVYVGAAPSPDAPATVVALAPISSLTTGAGSVALGDKITLSATVRTPAGALVTTGSLTFYVGSSAVATALYDPVTGTFHTVWTVLGTITGDQTVSAVYGGYAGGAASLAPSSVSTPVTVVKVAPPAPTFSGTAPGAPAFTLDPVAGISFAGGTGVAGASINVYVNGTLIGTLPVDANGHIVGTLPLPYGANQTITATQSTVGGTSPVVNLGKATVLPPAPSIPALAVTTSFTSSTAGGSAQTLAIQGVPGSTLTVTDSGGVAIATNVAANATGGFSLPVSLGYGTHSLTFTVNINGVSSSTTVVVTVLPAQPSVPSIAAGQAFIGATPTATTTAVPVVASGLVPGATLQVWDGATLVGSFPASAAGAVSASIAFGYGPHSVHYVVVAPGWNGGTAASVATAPVAFDVKPAAPAVAGPADGAHNITQVVQVSGSGVPGAVVTFFDGTVNAGTFTVAADGTFAGTISLFYGVHTLTTSQSINLETSAASAATSVAVYPAAPALTTVAASPTNNPGFAGASALGDATRLPVVTVYDGATFLASVAPNAAGAWSFNALIPTKLLADGQHTLGFTTTINGMESAASQGSFMLWTLSPQLAITAPLAGSLQSTASQPLAYTAAAGYLPPAGVWTAQVDYRLDGTLLYSGAPAGAPAAADLTYLVPGSHVFTISSIDNLGNANATPFSSTFQYGPSIDTDLALTSKLLGPLAAACRDDDGDDHRAARSEKADDHHGKGKRCLSRGQLHSLLEMLAEARQSLIGEEGEDLAEGRRNAAEQLWHYELKLKKLELQGRVPAALSALLTADVDYMLAQLGGPPKEEHEGDRG